VGKWEIAAASWLQLGEYKQLCEVVMLCYSEQMKLLLVALGLDCHTPTSKKTLYLGCEVALLNKSRQVVPCVEVG